MQFTTKLFTAFLALIALMQFVSGATLYSEMKDDTPITVGVSGVALADGCAPQKYTSGSDTLTVTWSGLSAAPAKIAIKLCYTKDQIVDRAWRKFKDKIEDNKQCQQTADSSKFLVDAFDSTGLSGSKDVKIPINTAPTTYTVQVLAMDADGAIFQYGDSTTTECHIDIDTYDRTPKTLQGTMGFFCAFSMIVAGTVWIFDVKKQNAIAAQWAQ